MRYTLRRAGQPGQVWSENVVDDDLLELEFNLGHVILRVHVDEKAPGLKVRALSDTIVITPETANSILVQ